MPHLHLPIDHTDADLVLAANLADIVGSEDLYVTWSYETGPGAVPEIDAVMVEQRPLRPLSELVAALAAGFAGMWRALTGRSRHAAAAAAPPADQARRTAEPSA
jgi:hypothetical protein